MDRAHLREAAQRVDQLLALEALPRRGHEQHERLAGVAALTDHQVAQVAGLVLLVVGLEVLGTRPVADGVADRVPEVGRQPALLDLEHLVPATGLVEAERGPVGRLRERVLHLVAVVEGALGGNDRLERRLRDPADPPERVVHLLVLRGGLGLVRQVLEATAAARRVVGAGRLHARGARLDDLRGERLGVIALHLRDPRANRVARKPPAHEDDEAVQPRDAVAAVGERLDPKLELLVDLDGRGHRRRVPRGARAAAPWGSR